MLKRDVFLCETLLLPVLARFSLRFHHRALAHGAGSRDISIVGESPGVHPGGEGHSGDSPAFSSSVWLLEWKRRRTPAGPVERQAEKRAGPVAVLPAFDRKD